MTDEKLLKLKEKITEIEKLQRRIRSVECVLSKFETASLRDIEFEYKTGDMISVDFINFGILGFNSMKEHDAWFKDLIYDRLQTLRDTLIEEYRKIEIE
ncbi:MAG TPA: hypothetical protein VK190_02670 [Pseudoneobacillus sp.]|nr:hypothetical protein [Pseudoneobacillus sp.]